MRQKWTISTLFPDVEWDWRRLKHGTLLAKVVLIQDNCSEQKRLYFTACTVSTCFLSARIESKASGCVDPRQRDLGRIPKPGSTTEELVYIKIPPLGRQYHSLQVWKQGVTTCSKASAVHGYEVHWSCVLLPGSSNAQELQQS